MTTNPPEATPTLKPSTITYDPSVALVLANQAALAKASALELVIDSDTMLELAGEDLRGIKTLQKKVEEQRTSITAPLNAAVKAVNDLFRAPNEFLATAETQLKRAINVYTAEQERLAAIARAQAEEAARQERERLASIEVEQRAAAQAAQQVAQAAMEAGDVSAAEDAAADAHTASMNAMAAQMSATVVTAVPAVASAVAPKGISARLNYSAQVTDLMELVKAVANGQAPIEALAADVKFIGAQARAFKKAGQLYPGVSVIAERAIAARSK